MKIFRLLMCLLTLSGSLACARASQIEVKISGKGSPAIVFIPGLATPGDIWDDTVAQFKGQHACYAVTLAGFGGKPPVRSDRFVEDSVSDIIAYMTAQKINKPTIIGHSMGGVMALKIAIEAPELPGRIIVVDSVPFLAALMKPGISAADAAEMAAGFRKTMSAQTQAQFAEGQKEFVGSMVTAPDRAAAVAAMTGRSDPATTGQAMGEMLLDDLRPVLGAIKCPVLVLGAMNGGAAAGSTVEATEAAYRRQYEKLSQARFQWFENARHFIMVDDPAGFCAAVRKDLKEP